MRRKFAWLTGWIILAGVATAGLVHLTWMDPDATGLTRIIMLATFVLAGLCAIIASSER